MAETFYQLGQLLLGSIPTIVIFVLLHFYLRRVLYRPLQQVLAARAERIEGRQTAAREALAAAEAKLLAYEEALRQRRQENYRRIEAQRQLALAAGQQVLSQARHQAAAATVVARQQLAGETEQARRHLRGNAEQLAEQIVRHILSSGAQQGRLAPGAGA